MSLSPYTESREYLIAEGLVCREGDVAVVMDALDDLFLLGELSDEGFVVNDEQDGTTRGTTTQEYMYFHDAKKEELPKILSLDITYTKHPTFTNPLLQYDVSARITSDLRQPIVNHFRLIHDGEDGFAWVFVPDDGTEDRYFRRGTWKEMNMDELDILHDVLGEAQSLHSKIEKAVDA